jgi:hypothetical protein
LSATLRPYPDQAKRAQSSRRLRTARDLAHRGERGNERLLYASAARKAAKTLKALAGHQDEIIGGIGREPSKPCHNGPGVWNVPDGDQRAANRYCAVLLQHAREQIELARFRHHNPLARQGTAHLCSPEREPGVLITTVGERTTRMARADKVIGHCQANGICFQTPPVSFHGAVASKPENDFTALT